MNLTIKTVLHSYQFDTSSKEGQEGYSALCAQLKELDKFCAWGGKDLHLSHLSGKTVALETNHLFSNQWDTAPVEGSKSGLRVFDWAENYPINFRKSVKRGHYLVQTEEMREIRRNTCGCGYCGKQEPAQKGYVFCPHCLGSEYLTEKDLFLLRMLPVGQHKSTRPPLTVAEFDYLRPLFLDAQVNGGSDRKAARIAKARADLLKSRDTAVHCAVTEFSGFTWLMDRGIKTDNVIYYGRTDVFCFGWRKPLDSDMLAHFKQVTEGFPFAVEFKGE